MATTWYFRDTNAVAGPTGKASTDTDTWPSVPADKNTPKDMGGVAGSGEHNDGSNQFPSTTTSARYALGRIFVGPPLAAQTLTGAQAGFKVACGIFESSASMNLFNRIFAYIWRSGSGNVKTIGVPVSCPTEHTSKAEDVITFAGASGDFSILANDRIIVELWFDVRNSKNTTYTATHYYDGTDNTMVDGTAPTASQCGGYFYSPQTLNLNSTTYTKTVSLDSYLQKIYTPSTSLDATLNKTGQIKISSLDGTLNKINQTKTASLDSYLSKTFPKTLSIDSLLNKIGLEKMPGIDGLLNGIGLTRVSSLDSLLNKLDIIKSLSLDAILYAVITYTRTVSLDSVLSKLDLTKSSSLDSLLQKLSITRSASLDSFLYAIIGKTIGIDATLFKELTKTTSLDGVLSQGIAKTVSLDSLLNGLGLIKTASLDSLLHKLDLTKSTSLDALILGMLSRATSLDAYLQKSFVRNASIDSYLYKTDLKTSLLDAILYSEEAGIKEIFIDALLQKLAQTKGLSMDGYLQSLGERASDLDAILMKTIGRSVSADALLIKGLSASALLDAILIIGDPIGIRLVSLDSILNASFSAGVGMDACLYAISIPGVGRAPAGWEVDDEYIPDKGLTTKHDKGLTTKHDKGLT